MSDLALYCQRAMLSIGLVHVASRCRHSNFVIETQIRVRYKVRGGLAKLDIGISGFSA